MVSAAYSRTRTKGSSGIASGARGQYDKLYFGRVMDNSDVHRMGRLRVYVPELGGEQIDENSWVTVQYCSPFAGATNPWRELGNELYTINEKDAVAPAKRRKGGNTIDQNTYEGTQQSYGFWMIPPDLNNEVVVAFASGDPARGFWFGCLYQQYMNHMVPGVAAGKSYQGNNVPLSEYNRLVSDPATASTAIRPEHKPLHNGLTRQGLVRDSFRGISNASARREAPSEVFGILTPRGSHFVMDDNRDSEMIRLRTRSGTQLLLSETNGHVYMISRDGRTWLELNNDGNVDIYGSASFSVRAEQDINLHADQNVNIEGKSVNIRATGGGAAIEAAADMDLRAGGTMRQASGASFNVAAGGDYVESASKILMNMQAADVAGPAGAASRIPEPEPWPAHNVQGEFVPPGDPSAFTGNLFNAYKEANMLGKEEQTEKDFSDRYKSKDPPPGACEDNKTLKMSEAGTLMLIGKEGFVPYNYVGAEGHGYTIGYGNYSSSPNQFPNGLTEEEAFALYQKRLQEFEGGVKSAVKACLTQCQFDALVSMAYNLGEAFLRNSTDLKAAIERQDHDAAAAAILRYIYVKKDGVKQVNNGLVNRRKIEAELYRFGRYPSSPTRAALKKQGEARCRDRNPSPAGAMGMQQAASAYKRMTGRDLA